MIVLHGWYAEHTLLALLLILMGIDVISGLLVAYRTQSINSSVTFRGNTKKAGVLLLIMVATVLEAALQSVTKKPAAPVSDYVTVGFIIWEVTSIIEKLHPLGVPIPKGFRDALAKLRQIVNEPLFSLRFDSSSAVPIKAVEPVQVVTDAANPVDVKPVPNPEGERRRITDQ